MRRNHKTCCEQRALPSVGGAESSVGELTATSGESAVNAGTVDTMWTDSLWRRGASCAINSYNSHTTHSQRVTARSLHAHELMIISHSCLLSARTLSCCLKCGGNYAKMSCQFFVGHSWTTNQQSLCKADITVVVITTPSSLIHFHIMYYTVMLLCHTYPP